MLSGHTITATDLQRIYDAGTQLLHMPATPFEGVAETLDQLSQHYTLICLTKGDLLDQQNKLRRSGLKPYFNHIEIVAEKTVGIYANLCHRYSTTPSHFVMTGNSFKSDIDPVLQIGGYGIHIPFKRMWAYEKTEEYIDKMVYQIRFKDKDYRKPYAVLAKWMNDDCVPHKHTGSFYGEMADGETVGEFLGRLIA